MENIIGKVAEEEKQEIETLFQRKLALKEIMLLLGEPSRSILETNILYEKVLKDLGETTAKLEKWWKDKAEKYLWKRDEKTQLRINFDTNEIIKVDNQLS